MHEGKDLKTLYKIRVEELTGYVVGNSMGEIRKEYPTATEIKPIRNSILCLECCKRSGE